MSVKNLLIILLISVVVFFLVFQGTVFLLTFFSSSEGIVEEGESVFDTLEEDFDYSLEECGENVFCFTERALNCLPTKAEVMKTDAHSFSVPLMIIFSLETLESTDEGCLFRMYAEDIFFSEDILPEEEELIENTYRQESLCIAPFDEFEDMLSEWEEASSFLLENIKVSSWCD